MGHCYFAFCFIRWLKFFQQTALTLVCSYTNGTWTMVPPLCVSNALGIICDIGPTLGLHLNPTKCELFNRCNDFKLFPPEMKTSTCTKLDILGSPIGDAQYCSTYIASKRSAASNLLLEIEKVALQDSHVALMLLCMCGGFSKLSHIARTTPPTIATDELGPFDLDVMNCLSECLAIEMPPMQGQRTSPAEPLTWWTRLQITCPSLLCSIHCLCLQHWLPLGHQ